MAFHVFDIEMKVSLDRIQRYLERDNRIPEYESDFGIWDWTSESRTLKFEALYLCQMIIDLHNSSSH